MVHNLGVHKWSYKAKEHAFYEAVMGHTAQTLATLDLAAWLAVIDCWGCLLDTAVCAEGLVQPI